MVRYTKLVICNDYDTFAAAYLSYATFFETCVYPPPPPVTPFLRYDTCTPIAQTLRYLQLVSRIRKLIIEVKTICYKLLQNYM